MEVYHFSNKIRLGSKSDGGYVIWKLDGGYVIWKLDGDYDCYISCGTVGIALYLLYIWKLFY